MTGYKVVLKRKNGLRQSAVKRLFRSQPSVSYFLGQTIHRPEGHGPLAVFSTLKNARHWVRGYVDKDEVFDIFEVTYKESKDKRLFYILPSGFEIERADLPEGTRLADSLEMGTTPVGTYQRILAP